MKKYRKKIKIKLMWHDAVLLSVWLEDIKLNRELRNPFLENAQNAERMERVLDRDFWSKAYKAYIKRRGK